MNQRSVCWFPSLLNAFMHNAHTSLFLIDTNTTYTYKRTYWIHKYKNRKSREVINPRRLLQIDECTFYSYFKLHLQRMSSIMGTALETICFIDIQFTPNAKVHRTVWCGGRVAEATSCMCHARKYIFWTKAIMDRAAHGTVAENRWRTNSTADALHWYSTHTK